MFPVSRAQKIYRPDDERYGPASPLNGPSPACGGSVSSSSEAKRLTMGEVFLFKQDSPLRPWSAAQTPGHLSRKRERVWLRLRRW